MPSRGRLYRPSAMTFTNNFTLTRCWRAPFGSSMGFLCVHTDGAALAAHITYCATSFAQFGFGCRTNFEPLVKDAMLCTNIRVWWVFPSGGGLGIRGFSVWGWDYWVRMDPPLETCHSARCRRRAGKDVRRGQQCRSTSSASSFTRGLNVIAAPDLSDAAPWSYYGVILQHQMNADIWGLPNSCSCSNFYFKIRSFAHLSKCFEVAWETSGKTLTAKRRRLIFK